MKKLFWNILFTLCAIAVLLFCIKSQKEAYQTDMGDYFSFVVPNNEAPEQYEKINCWKKDDNSYYVFLPSYAEMKEVKIAIDSLKK